MICYVFCYRVTPAIFRFYGYIHHRDLHSFPTRRSSDLIQASAVLDLTEDDFDFLTSNKVWIATDRSRARRKIEIIFRSEERFSRNAETDLVCRLLLEKKNKRSKTSSFNNNRQKRN